MLDIGPLGSESVDPHIFADPDPDPGSQNFADSTDPDPKLCLKDRVCFSRPITKEQHTYKSNIALEFDRV